MNFINFACNEYKTMHHGCYTRPFSYSQAVKGHAGRLVLVCANSGYVSISVQSCMPSSPKALGTERVKIFDHQFLP